MSDALNQHHLIIHHQPMVPHHQFRRHGVYGIQKFKRPRVAVLVIDSDIYRMEPIRQRR